MFRAAYAHRTIAIFAVLSLLGASLAPSITLASGNLCAPADAMCTPSPDLVGKPCYCYVPPSFHIIGKCTAVETCTGVAAPGPTGIMGSISSFATAHPILTMFGVGTAMSLGSSLLGSLLSPSAGSSGSGSGYAPGICTTQYFYTSDPNALADPCAIFNPSSTHTCATVTAPLCLSGTLQPQPNDSNNCPVAPVCVPATCPTVVTPLCLNGTLQPQPNDSNNCPVASKCITSTATSTQDTLTVSPLSGAAPLSVTANFTSGTSCSDAYDLAWGDGAPDVTMSYAPPAFGSACVALASVNTPTHTYTTAGIYTPTLRSGTNLQFTSSVTVTVSAAASSTPTIGLAAAPTSGSAPLAVQFTGAVLGTSYLVYFDDGSAPVAGSCTAGGANCGVGNTTLVNITHTYMQNGVYQAFVQDSSGVTRGSATVTVGSSGSAGSSTEVPISTVLNSTIYYGDATSASTPDASQTPLAHNAAPAPGQGLHGDLLSAGGGATIYATNVAGNTTVSGFFGANSAPAQLCATRPWSTNFLSYVIPPTFFDGLCSAAGYPAGAQQPSVISAGAPAPQSVSVAPPQQSKPQYTGGAHAAATIWARPPFVSIGGRTNIFWISQNVSSCTESSSDGNFTGSSTSGGASTVSLSGPVTFTIKCLALDGTSVSNSTTVTIGS